VAQPDEKRKLGVEDSWFRFAAPQASIDRPFRIVGRPVGVDGDAELRRPRAVVGKWGKVDAAHRRLHVLRPRMKVQPGSS
jgi:hypothetical protein